MSEQTKTEEVQYHLTVVERNTFTQMRANATVIKAQIYDLNVQLEAAQQSLLKSDAELRGATTALLIAHDMQFADISPDYSLIRKKDRP